MNWINGDPVDKIIDALSDRNLREVSRRTGVSYSTIRGIVKGRVVDPTVGTMTKLDEYLRKSCELYK